MLVVNDVISPASNSSKQPYKSISSTADSCPVNSFEGAIDTMQ